MIKLEVQPYCEDCLVFEPDVEHPHKFYTVGATIIDPYKVNLTDTVIRCTKRNTCAGIKRYLEKEMQKGEKE